LEGGFLWHRPVIARLSFEWEAKRARLADATKSPVDCVRDHVRFGSQPMESPPIERDLASLLALAEADRTLMFSSDYPHYDYDMPGKSLPHGISEHMRQRIMCENALELYGLPASRPVDSNDGEDPS